MSPLRRLSAVVLLGALTPTAASQLEVFENEVEFLERTCAISQGDYPPVGTTTAPVPLGELVIQHVAPTMDSIVAEWTLVLEGDDLGFSGPENFDVQLAAPAWAFGFQVVDPLTPGPPPGCNFPTCLESTFEVGLWLGPALVGSVQTTLAGDSQTFLGFQSVAPFDRVSVRELTDDIGNEYFGNMYVGRCPTSFVYGPPTPGTGEAVPLLPPPSPALKVGGLGSLEASGLLGGAPVLLALGAEPLQQTVKGIELLVNPLIYLPVVNGGAPGVAGAGGFSLPLSVSNEPVYDGLTLYLQVIVLDDGGPALGYASSAGLALTICPGD